MATLREVDHTAVCINGPDIELLLEEKGEQTAERRLIDISEEALMQELEPHVYHCYSGWEEAVRGWARVAPMSCILLAQKRDKKPKHKETDNTTPLSVDPTIPDADNSASTSEHDCESHVGLHNSLKKSMSLKQHAASRSYTAVGAQQKNASEWPVLNAIQKTRSNPVPKDKIKKEVGLRETPSQPHHLMSKYSENRSTKHQKHRQRPNNAVVPIKNFAFLPPIQSPYLNPQKVSGQFCSGIKVPELHNYSAALTSKYQTYQHNPHLFSAVSVSVPKKYQVPMSSKPDTVHCTTYSVDETLTQALHSGTAGGAQAHMHPGKTNVCM